MPGVIAGLSECAPNELVIRVQPDERIFWKITSKVPGLDFSVETRRMDLLYALDGPTTSRTGAGVITTRSNGSDQAGGRLPTIASNEPGPTVEVPGAYERLILEVLRGDQTNFVHADELIASWRIFTPVLRQMSQVTLCTISYFAQNPKLSYKRTLILI